MQPRPLVAALVLVVVTMGAFAGVRQLGFVNYDDPGYVTANPRVQQGITLDNVRWALTTDAMVNWHPLTWLSHMLDVELFGLSPGGHHVTSVVLHALNAVLVLDFFWVTTATFWPSLLTAALFALHPLHVESVAWVSERKDVLSTAFALFALLAYVRWQRRPSRAGYGLVAALLGLGLMAKPMLVTLPFVMLLLDVWPLGRWHPTSRANARALVGEKVPLFGIVVLSSLVTLLLQHRGGAVRSTAELPVVDRLGNAVLAYAGYLEHTFWPLDLACFYPIHLPLPWGRVAGSLLVLSAITAAALAIARRHPYVVVGWFWFLGTLVPVLGLAQVGPQAMADRYTYFPSIGLFVVMAWGGAALASRWRIRPLALAVPTLAVLAACFLLTRVQVSYWRDSRTLFSHALAVTSANHIAHANLGAALAADGESGEALAQFRAALAIAPNFVEVHRKLARELTRIGDPDQALSHLEAAVRFAPGDADARYELGNALAAAGRTDDAIGQLEAALRLDAERPDFHNAFGVALADAGRETEAQREYAEAIRLAPDYVDPRINRAASWRRSGRLDDALAELETALRLDPSQPDGHYMVGNVLAQLGRLDEAAIHYARALELQPTYAHAANNLGLVLAAQGKLDEAIRRYSEALAIAPEMASAYFNRAAAYRQRGEGDRAAADLARARALDPRTPEL